MPAPPVSSIEISKDYLHFNAAHFTLFSATEREDLHGHTFYVAATVTSHIGNDGLAFDYNVFKTAMKALCDELDEKVLLPELSPHLRLETDAGYLVARFADERIPFLPRDVLTLPVRNVTVEEMAGWFLTRLREQPRIAGLGILSLELRVSSGPGQWAASRWDAAGGDA